MFPGGFGTLDELFEMLTLMQTRKIERRIPIVLYGSDYWNEIVDFDALVRHGMVSREDLALFRFADDPAQRARNPADGDRGGAEAGDAVDRALAHRRPLLNAGAKRCCVAMIAAASVRSSG